MRSDFAADLGEEGLGNLCGVRALVDHYEKNLCGMAAFDLYRDKMYPSASGLSGIGFRQKQRAVIPS